MKHTPAKMRPEKQIRIPLAFTKTLDKVSLLQLKTLDQFSRLQLEKQKKSTIQKQKKRAKDRIESSGEEDKKIRTLSVQTRGQLRDPSGEGKETERAGMSRDKSGSKIRFRTTGAGFRQKVNRKVQPQPLTGPSKPSQLTFRRTSVRPSRPSLPFESSQDYQTFKEYLVQKTQYERREQPVLERRIRPPRITFGERFSLRNQPQFVYNQKFSIEDIEWSDEVTSFRKAGFGVSSNLSLFDVSSLEDPKGEQFMEKHGKEVGWCPVYQNEKYSWIEVRVIGFDLAASQVLVHRLAFDDIKKVSRLSIRFGQDQHSTAAYWLRVHQAKQYQQRAHEHSKFNRYVYSRPEVFYYPFGSFRQLSQKWQQSIQREWFTYYSRLLLIYREMEILPQKFIDMGLRLRKYEPFIQPPIVCGDPDFDETREKLSRRHYSRFDKFPHSLYKLFERLTSQACSAVELNINLGSIHQLAAEQCRLVQGTTATVRGKIRQFLIADIMGQLAFAFKTKEEERKYYRLHDMIYRDLIISHLYISNISKWTSYLQSFQIWTRDTPEPIVQLTLDVDVKGKKIKIDPEEQTVRELLGSPLKMLEKETQKTPDLLSQINGGRPKTISISHSLLPSAMENITLTVRHSFEPVIAFANSYNDKLVYLQKIQWKRQMFSSEGRQIYRSSLEDLKKALRQVTHTVIGRCGFLAVNADPLKKALGEAINKQRNRLGKIIERQIAQEVQRVGQEFTDRTEYLKNTPSNEKELIAMRRYLNEDCQLFMDSACDHYDLCHSFFRLLEDHYIPYTIVSFEKNMQMTLVHSAFISTISGKLSVLLFLQQEMIDQINEEREAIMRGMEEMGDKIQTIRGFSSLTDYNQNYIFANRNYLLLESYTRQLENINERQKTLSQQISVFPMLGKLEGQLRPFYQLWNIVYQLTNQIQSMKSEAIHKINHSALKEHLREWSKQLQRLNSVFTNLKNGSAVLIIEKLNQKIKYAEDKLWIVRAFTLEGVIKKEAIRKEILDTIFRDKQYSFSELSMEQLLAAGVEDHKQYVIKNAEKAQRIWKLQLRIQAIVNTVKILELVLEEQDSVPTVDDKLLLGLSCAVHEQLELMDDIKDLQEAQYIQKKVNNVHNRLKFIEDTLVLMRQFQSEFFKMRRLVAVEEVAQEMERQRLLFSDVQKLWRGMCAHFSKDLEVWEAIDSDGYKHKLQNMLKLMGQVDRKIDEVIDRKKTIFPRLFYLQKEEVKQLTVNPDKIGLSKYMGIMFAGVRGWLDDADQIRGFVGTQREKVTFKTSIRKTLVWHNLKATSEELGKIVAWEINLANNKKQTHTFGKMARTLVEQTFAIEEALSKKELGKMQNRVAQQIQKLQFEVSNESCIIASLLIYFRDKVAQLVRKNVSDLRNFEWRKELKYYRSEGEGVELRTCNFTLPFQHEYPSTDVRPYFILSDKVAIQTLLSAWTMNTGMVVQGQTHTIRQLCQTTFRHYIETPICTETSTVRLCALLKGYTLSGTWTTFVVGSPLKRELFDVIAQTAFEVHNVVESGRSLFSVGGQFFNLPKRFRFNLFLTKEQTKDKSQEAKTNYLELSGHEHKSYKFGLSFRNIMLVPPSQQAIVSIFLGSLGLQEQQILSLVAIFEHFKVKGLSKWYHSPLINLLASFKEEYFREKDRKDAREVLRQVWSRQLRIDHIRQIFEDQKVQDESSTLLETIKQIDRSEHTKSQIILVGPYLSGKHHLITSIFSQLNVALLEPLEYDLSHLKHWICLEEKLYTKDIPAQQKLVLRAKENVSIEPTIGSFVVLYHRKHLQWNQMMPQKMKESSLPVQVQKEIVRQLGILFQQPGFSPQLSPSHRSSSIALCLSLLKVIELFHLQGKMANLNLIQRQQMIFMFVYWQAAAIHPQTTLDPLLFGSSVPRQPMNYYYDPQKSAWIEWVTLSEYHRPNTSSDLRQLFVPVRESMALIYFISHCAYRSNLWLQAEQSGTGLHRLIESLLTSGLVQFYRAHKNVNYEGFSRLINYDVAIFKKEGKYFPKLNQTLTIVVEDINLSLHREFEDRLSTLLNHRYDSHLKREIAKTSFVCTNYDLLIHENMSLNIAKSIVHVRASAFSQQSRKVVFSYYLQWFFGNTENPFSKEVRLAAQIIVQGSVFIMEVLNSGNKQQLVSMGNMVQIFEGICISSPKTVKSTADILELWWHECKMVLWNERYRLGAATLESVVKRFIEENRVYYDPVLIDCLSRATDKDISAFVKLTGLPVDYAETYRKVDRTTLYSYLEQGIRGLDYTRFSHLPLLVYPDLLNFITKVLRILVIPHRHVLLHGGRFSCQKIIFRLASYLHFGVDCAIIGHIDHWRERLSEQLRPLISENVPKCITFSLGLDEADSFLEVVEQLIMLHHPRSFLLKEDFKYLSMLGLSSSGSYQYKNMLRNIQKGLTCCITSPLPELSSLELRYPALMRRVEALNSLQNYCQGGLGQMASVSIGHFYSTVQHVPQIDQIFLELHTPISKQKWLRILQLILHYHSKSLSQIQNQLSDIRAATERTRQLEKNRVQLEKELQKLKINLGKVVKIVEQLWQDYKENQEKYQSMVNNYNEYNEECEKERQKTDAIRKDVQKQYSKVEPILTTAQEAMAKVTRDDINQLRSFPNPPLPAAKVVESLVFLFNESHLVKEKVLQGGEKVRDFWEYAKKMILNDQLLKRVKELSPQTIKNMPQGIIVTLKSIIKRPQFVEQRVFKASSAAGNLSLWVKAIVAVYDVMVVIEPKRRILNEAEQILSSKEEHLKALLDQLNAFHELLMVKKGAYEAKVEDREAIQTKIRQIQQYIQNAGEILGVLHGRQTEWKVVKEVELPGLLAQCEHNAVVLSIYIELLVPLNIGERDKVVEKLKEVGFDCDPTYFYRYLFLQEYQESFHSILNTQSDQSTSQLNIPLTPNYIEGLVTLHELVSFNKKTIVVHDQTKLLHSYLRSSKVAKMTERVFQMVDCLQVSDVAQFLVSGIREKQDQQQEEEAQENIRREKNVVVLTELEHCPRYMEKYAEIVKKYQSSQVIVLIQKNTPEIMNTMRLNFLSFDLTLHSTTEIVNYLTKQIFGLPLPVRLELNRSVDYLQTKRSFFRILVQKHDLIRNEEVLDEWLNLHQTERKMKSEKVVYRKPTRIQEEKVSEAVTIMNQKTKISMPTYLKIIRQYFKDEQITVEPTLSNFPEYLGSILKNYPDSLVKVVQPHSPDINLLGFFILKYSSIEQLQRSLVPVEESSTRTLEGIEKKLSSMSWEIVSPLSVFHCIKQNQSAFLSLTSKYKLRKALQECQLIEKIYRNEYFEEFFERDKASLGYIYLLSQCGQIDVDEILDLDEKECNKVILGNYETQKKIHFGRVFFMEMFNKRFSNLPSDQRKYIAETVFRVESEDSVL